MFGCLSACGSVYFSIHTTVSISVHLYIVHTSIGMSVHCLYIGISMVMIIHLYIPGTSGENICLSVGHLHASQDIYLPIHPSIV